MNEKLRGRLKEDDAFQEFISFLKAKANELENVSNMNLDELSNERAGEEAKIRREAANTIRAIIYPFDKTRDTEPSYEDIKKAKKRVGY